ncbi:hypothetical protein BU17DRAFT_71067 [Hysterangium stoloniferum]|nr:hypothetical protein BU17DRAFT_71067 [Hysterangium stoloniferum]
MHFRMPGVRNHFRRIPHLPPFWFKSTTYIHSRNRFAAIIYKARFVFHFGVIRPMPNPLLLVASWSLTIESSEYPPGENVFLNCAQRAPYLRNLEILHDDLDFDPSKKENTEVLRKMALKEIGQQGGLSELPDCSTGPNTAPSSTNPRYDAVQELLDVKESGDVPTLRIVVPPTPLDLREEELVVDVVEQLYGPDLSLRSWYRRASNISCQAGLFGAILNAFLIESRKDLQMNSTLQDWSVQLRQMLYVRDDMLFFCVGGVQLLPNRPFMFSQPVLKVLRPTVLATIRRLTTALVVDLDGYLGLPIRDGVLGYCYPD